MKKEILEQDSEFRIRKEYLATALHKINQGYSHQPKEGSLTIIYPLIESLAVATAALVMRHGAPSLLLSARIALIGIEKEKSQAGVLGKTLSKLAKGISNFIIETDLSKEDVGSQQLFEAFVQILMISSIAILWNMTQHPMTHELVEYEESEEQHYQAFGVELILVLIFRTRIISLLTKNALFACGFNEKQYEDVVKMMHALIIVLSLLTSAKTVELMQKFASNFKEDLIQGLEGALALIDRSQSTEKIENLSSIKLYIQQALANLQEENFELLYKTYEEVLELLQSNPKIMQDEMEEVFKFSKTLSDAFWQGAVNFNQVTASQMI